MVSALQSETCHFSSALKEVGCEQAATGSHYESLDRPNRMLRSSGMRLLRHFLRQQIDDSTIRQVVHLEFATRFSR